MRSRDDPSGGSAPDLVDVFIVLLFSSAIIIFLLTVATQFVSRPEFQTLPGFLTDAYRGVWTSVASGTAGVGLVIVKSLAFRGKAYPNYFLLVLITSSVLLGAIVLIALAARWLNPQPMPSPPLGAAMIDIDPRSPPASKQFEFVSLPGSNVTFHMHGTYLTEGRDVTGHMDSGSLKVSEEFNPAFNIELRKITFRSCYVHNMSGIYQMDLYPFPGKAAQSTDIGGVLQKGKSYELPAMNFEFKIADDARQNLTWLCAGIENSVGFFPAQ